VRRGEEPVSPSRTMWGVPPTAVATHGVPACIASRMLTGRPSRCEGRQKASAAASSVPTSSR
jgi:hypothetical protein